MPRARTRRPAVRRPLLAVALCGALAGGTVPAVAAPPAPPAPPELPAETSLVLRAPARVVDERSVRLRARLLTTDGAPVTGATVLFEQASAGRWRTVATRRTDRAGVALLDARPREDTRWRSRGLAGTDASGSWAAATSAPVRIDNVPPLTPLRLPGPRPAALRAQERAVGQGANPSVRRIPDRTWRTMVGRSWRAGCPVGRPDLRVLAVNYWAFDGYRRRGEIVLSKAVVRRAAAAFSAMYARELPLRSMYRVDRFGWSRELRGADDRASMRADNTSGFNCRQVVGRPGVRSPHATGRAIDLNPWENPYRTLAGWVPNPWWVGRSHPQVAWRSAQHPVVQIWRKHGFRWTYGTSDSQHQDGRRTPSGDADFLG